MKLLFFLLFATVQAVPPDVLRTLPLDWTDGSNGTTEQLLETVTQWLNWTVGLEMTSLVETVLKAGGMETTEEAKKCLSSLTGLFQNLQSHSTTRLLDSWPKLPAGILRRGPFFLLGDYDQCLEIQKTDPETHYCTVGANFEIGKTVPLTGGFCLPTSCSEPAFRDLVTIWLTDVLPDQATKLVELKEVHCQQAETGITWRRVLFYTIILLWGLLLLSGTYVDYKRRSTDSDGSPNISFDVQSVAGSDKEASFVPSREKKKPTLHLFNAPSIALTFRSVPDLKKQLGLKTTLVDVLCAFSIRVSLAHLFRNSARELSVLHGLKVFSAFWIILGHCCLFSLPYMDTVLSLSSNAVNPLFSSILFNSSLAVDSFLFVTGTVLAYTVRKRMLFRGPRDSSSTTVVHLLFFYIHRLARLWPALVFFAIFMSVFYSHLADGPLWNSNGIFGSQCTAADLTRLLLFVSNFSPSLCLPWLWHISLDFQLYLTAPIFLFFLSKINKRLVLGAGFAIACSLGYRLAIFQVYSLPPNMFLGMLKEGRFEEGELHFKLLYGNPISRCPPFIVGILTGWFMCLQQKQKLSWLVVGGLKLTAYGLLGYALFAPMSQEDTLAILHAVLHRLLWSLGLAVLVWLSETGHHSLCQFFLASPRLLPISRLSFGLYLCHEPILLYLIWTQRQANSDYNFGHFILLGTTVTALSLVGAFFFAICFELPILSIERRLFKRTDTRFNRKKQNTSTAKLHRRVEKKLGRKATAALSFTEKTQLWLTNVENPYRELVEGGIIRDEEEEELDSITTMPQELLLEEEALRRE